MMTDVSTTAKVTYKSGVQATRVLPNVANLSDVTAFLERARQDNAGMIAAGTVDGAGVVLCVHEIADLEVISFNIPTA
jgi:hypothetical protein